MGRSRSPQFSLSRSHCKGSRFFRRPALNSFGYANDGNDTNDSAMVSGCFTQTTPEWDMLASLTYLLAIVRLLTVWPERDVLRRCFCFGQGRDVLRRGVFLLSLVLSGQPLLESFHTDIYGAGADKNPADIISGAEQIVG
jgi:hypothetical protein